MLQSHQLNDNIKKALAVAFCVDIANKADKTMNKAIDDAIDKTVDRNKNKKIIDVKEFSNKFSDNPFSTSSQQIIPITIGDREGEIDETERKLLKELFEKTYEDNNIVKTLMDAKARALQKLPTALTKKGIRLSIGNLKIESEQLYMKNKMYVPENKPLQLFLLQQHHNPLIHGHPGYKAIY